MRKLLKVLFCVVFYVGVIGGGIALIIYELAFKAEPDYTNVAKIGGFLTVYVLAVLSTAKRWKKQVADINLDAYGYIIRDAFANNPRAYKQLMKGIMCYNRDQLKKGIQILEKLEPECVSVNEYVAVRDFEALCYMESEQYEKAIRIYEEILKRDSFFADGYNNLGNCYLEEGKLAKAIEVLQRAVEYNPAEGYAYANLAAAYARQGDAQKALEIAEKAIEIDSGILEAISTAATSAKMLGDYEKVDKYRNIYSLNGGDLEEIDEDLEQVIGGKLSNDGEEVIY